MTQIELLLLAPICVAISLHFVYFILSSLISLFKAYIFFEVYNKLQVLPGAIVTIYLVQV